MGIYISAAVVFAIFIMGAGAIGYSKGSASRNGEIAELSAAIQTAQALAAEADERANAVSERVVIEYRDRVKVIKEKEPGEIQLIEVIRRDATCDLPPAYRVLWDGAPSGGAEAQPPGGVDGAPVAVADAAETAAEARRRFEINAARLAALQEIIRSQ